MKSLKKSHFNHKKSFKKHKSKKSNKFYKKKKKTLKKKKLLSKKNQLGGSGSTVVVTQDLMVQLVMAHSALIELYRTILTSGSANLPPGLNQPPYTGEGQAQPEFPEGQPQSGFLEGQVPPGFSEGSPPPQPEFPGQVPLGFPAGQDLGGFPAGQVPSGFTPGPYPPGFAAGQGEFSQDPSLSAVSQRQSSNENTYNILGDFRGENPRLSEQAGPGSGGAGGVEVAGGGGGEDEAEDIYVLPTGSTSGEGLYDATPTEGKTNQIVRGSETTYSNVELDKRKAQTTDIIQSTAPGPSKKYGYLPVMICTSLYARGKPSTMLSARRAGRDGRQVMPN